MRMPELASTFRALAERGKAGFYSGRVASAVCEVLQAHGGLMTEADLAAHRSTFDSPVCVDFRGVKVWEMPPSGQGLVARWPSPLKRIVHPECFSSWSLSVVL